MKKAVSLVAVAVALLCCSAGVVAEKPTSATNIPLRVTIDGQPSNNPGSYGVVGDGRDYVDGEEGVSAMLQVGDLNNDFLMDPTNRRVSVPRALSFDFLTKIADGTIANPWYGSGMTMIDTYLNFKDVNTVPVGTMQERSGGFGLFPGGKTTYRLAFNPNYATAPNFTLINTPNWTSAVLVDHPDCNTWILTPKTAPYDEHGYGSGSGAVSTLISGTKSTGQYLMTFRITLNPKDPHYLSLTIASRVSHRANSPESRGATLQAASALDSVFEISVSPLSRDHRARALIGKHFVQQRIAL